MQLDTSTDPQVGFRPPGQLDAESALQRYRGPFGKRQAAHLARRAGFGVAPAELDALLARGLDGALESYMHPTEPEAAFTDYPDAALLYDPKKRYAAAKLWWLDRMLKTKRPLAEKMTLFWHGHFATSMAKVPPQLMVQQIDLFRSQALGNFRTLLLAVSQDPAMLIWLDNRFNVAAHPNENYAREIMELFALGLGNYTEADVKAAARAFTGWMLDKNVRFVFNEKAHDPGLKTFLGRTGSFNGEDVVAIIVEQPAHQRFLCRKLLEYFVYSDPEPELVDRLATVYAVSGYDLAKTVGTILRSNVFFSLRAYRALPKSPVEFAIGSLRYLGIADVPNDLPYWLARMDQDVLQPPSVKGWDGGPTWISTATLLARFNLINKLAGSTALQLTPDALVAQAGGMNAARVLETIVGGALQDDVTGDVRGTLRDFLDSKNADVPVPLGPENYQAKIRGALALVLNLPSNQLA
jgi:uncharacterized protein (DUF1800 family)